MFTTGSFVKNYYLNLRFFNVLQSTLLKTNKQKCILKKDALHLKFAWHNKRQRKNIEKSERKKKNEKKAKQKQWSFFYF